MNREAEPGAPTRVGSSALLDHVVFIFSNLSGLLSDQPAATAGLATARQTTISVLSAFSAVKIETDNRKERKDRKDQTYSVV